MIDSPSTDQEDLTAASEILGRGDGVSWAYELLEHLATRHRLVDAWLVLDPIAGRGVVPGVGSQLFGLGGRAVPDDRARALLLRPAGVYGEPRGLDTATSSALGAMCGAVFRASLASLASAVDPRSGLKSRHVIEEAVARSAACGARYGWSSTLVLLTTAGDAAPEERWLALGAALTQALRTGDEAGVSSPGVALAILGNAGPDAVRPFVARVRAALSAGGWDEIDLHAATATTPEETVDPAELGRLAAERLTEAGVVPSALAEVASTLELELRLLPAVVCVEMATPVVVVSSARSETLHDDALRAVRARRLHASVQVRTLSEEPSGHEGARQVTDAPLVYRREHPNGTGAARSEHAAPHSISAMAPSGNPATAPHGGTRVALLCAEFDPSRGASEVSLAFGAARGTGRASAGPLAGGAQATLNALEALAIDVPFYLVSAERAHGVPGEPVVVVLAPKRRGDDDDGPTAERLGVATGTGDVEAASRATLGALNRHLARSAAVL